MPTGFASTGANPHTQSFEEIYGIPENFLEIEVRLSSPFGVSKNRSDGCGEGRAREQSSRRIWGRPRKRLQNVKDRERNDLPHINTPEYL
jgi:hypothetical protein